ncbi:MAG: hypothetical protein KJN63_09005 [Acidimicrobiia bacterium]|nr:hypothetical protein [Acidimicrobiia bacterium]
MEYVILVVGAVIVVAIALIAVGGGVAKTASMPRQIVYDVQESIDFCAEALPDEVTATLSYDDLRRLLRLHLEWIQAYHFTPEGDPDGPLVFNNEDALAYVMERAAITGLPVSVEHARHVLDAHLAYFQFMGAVHVESPELVRIDLQELGLLESGNQSPMPELEDPQDPTEQ